MKAEMERRAYKRHELACPVVVNDAAGHELFRARTVNVSDGGALLEAPAGLSVGEQVHANLRVPRQTPNSFMYEDFFFGARVIRLDPPPHRPDRPRLALQFVQPGALELEV